jgi:hypothetical protein
MMIPAAATAAAVLSGFVLRRDAEELDTAFTRATRA